MNPANHLASNKLDLEETLGLILRRFVAYPAVGRNHTILDQSLMFVKLHIISALNQRDSANEMHDMVS